jgi:hypothetical protein
VHGVDPEAAERTCRSDVTNGDSSIEEPVADRPAPPSPRGSPVAAHLHPRAGPGLSRRDARLNSILAPGCVILAPGDAILAPGNAILAPGDAILAPGDAILAPGNAILAPGNAILAPGDAILAPGNVIHARSCVIHAGGRGIHAGGDGIHAHSGLKSGARDGSLTQRFKSAEPTHT